MYQILQFSFVIIALLATALLWKQNSQKSHEIHQLTRQLAEYEASLIRSEADLRTAWVQKEQMENIAEIVCAAQDMVERVGIFCHANAVLERDLERMHCPLAPNNTPVADPYPLRPDSI